MKGRTSFVIAHRLSTIDYASRVILLKNGSIAEQGTHSELMALKGAYFNLQSMQAAKTAK
jgi:subfamily B ATP-binding cassette protein MsbA